MPLHFRPVSRRNLAVEGMLARQQNRNADVSRDVDVTRAMYSLGQMSIHRHSDSKMLVGYPYDDLPNPGGPAQETNGASAEIVLSRTEAIDEPAEIQARSGNVTRLNDVSNYHAVYDIPWNDLAAADDPTAPDLDLNIDVPTGVSQGFSELDAANRFNEIGQPNIPLLGASDEQLMHLRDGRFLPVSLDLTSPDAATNAWLAREALALVKRKEAYSKSVARSALRHTAAVTNGLSNLSHSNELQNQEEGEDDVLPLMIVRTEDVTPVDPERHESLDGYPFPGAAPRLERRAQAPAILSQVYNELGTYKVPASYFEKQWQAPITEVQPNDQVASAVDVQQDEDVVMVDDPDSSLKERFQRKRKLSTKAAVNEDMAPPAPKRVRKEQAVAQVVPAVPAVHTFHAVPSVPLTAQPTPAPKPKKTCVKKVKTRCSECKRKRIGCDPSHPGAAALGAASAANVS